MFSRFKLNNNRGFTTLELLTTVFVFSLAAASIASILARSLELQRRSTVIQKIQENAMFVLESMAREIRVSAIRDQDSNCTATFLSLAHPVNGDISYSLSSGSVTRVDDDGDVGNLSSNDVEFTRLLFCITGSAVSDNMPTRITIIATIRDRSTKPIAPINLQTTIDSRDLTN